MASLLKTVPHFKPSSLSPSSGTTSWPLSLTFSAQTWSIRHSDRQMQRFHVSNWPYSLEQSCLETSGDNVLFSTQPMSVKIRSTCARNKGFERRDGKEIRDSSMQLFCMLTVSGTYHGWHGPEARHSGRPICSSDRPPTPTAGTCDPQARHIRLEKYQTEDHIAHTPLREVVLHPPPELKRAFCAAPLHRAPKLSQWLMTIKPFSPSHRVSFMSVTTIHLSPLPSRP